jgi:hypothetical protein
MTSPLHDYIAKQYASKKEFAAAEGVQDTAVTKWVKGNWIVHNGWMYSPRRELSGASSTMKALVSRIENGKPFVTGIGSSASEARKNATFMRMHTAEQAFIESQEDVEECKEGFILDLFGYDIGLSGGSTDEFTIEHEEHAITFELSHINEFVLRNDGDYFYVQSHPAPEIEYRITNRKNGTFSAGHSPVKTGWAGRTLEEAMKAEAISILADEITRCKKRSIEAMLENKLNVPPLFEGF